MCISNNIITSVYVAAGQFGGKLQRKSVKKMSSRGEPPRCASHRTGRKLLFDRPSLLEDEISSMKSGAMHPIL
jgi:hypothetical protein